MAAGRGCIIFKALIVRFLFVLHISLCLWRLYEEYNQQLGWWLIFGSSVFLLSIEAAITICCNKHGEWRTFVPSIFIYLLGTVPTLCLLEWEMLIKRLEYQSNFGTCPPYASNSTATFTIDDGVEELSYEWSLGLEQVLVILLVIGRWFLPKGKMSREKLSGLLLAYIGMSADILEFLSEGVQTERIRCEKVVILAILCLWAISLLQFSFGLNFTVSQQGKSLSRVHRTVFEQCGNSEIWGIMFAILIQDGPFLVMRLYLIGNYRILEQGLIFFTFKNILVLMLQLYRLWTLLCFTWDPEQGRFASRFIVPLCNSDRVGYENTRAMGYGANGKSHQDYANRGFEDETGLPGYDAYESPTGCRVPDGSSRESTVDSSMEGKPGPSAFQPHQQQEKAPHPAEQLFVETPPDYYKQTPATPKVNRDPRNQRPPTTPKTKRNPWDSKPPTPQMRSHHDHRPDYRADHRSSAPPTPKPSRDQRRHHPPTPKLIPRANSQLVDPNTQLPSFHPRAAAKSNFLSGKRHQPSTPLLYDPSPNEFQQQRQLEADRESIQANWQMHRPGKFQQDSDAQSQRNQSTSPEDSTSWARTQFGTRDAPLY